MASQKALFSRTCSSSSLGPSRTFSTSYGAFSATKTKPWPTQGNSSSPSFSQSRAGPRTQFTVHGQHERAQWSSRNSHRSQESPGQSHAGTVQGFSQRRPRNGNHFERQPERRSAPSWDLEPPTRQRSLLRQERPYDPVRRDAQGRAVLDRRLPHVTRENQLGGWRDGRPPARLRAQQKPAPVMDVKRITADEVDDILGEDILSSIPESEVRDTRDVFQAIEPDIARKTHARRLTEKSAVKGQRLIRPERETNRYAAEIDIVKPKRVAKLAPIKMLREVYLPKLVTVGNLAKIFAVRLLPLQRALLKAGFEDVNYDHLLTADDAALIAPDFGCNAIMNEEAAFDIYPPPPLEDLASLPIRPPVVAIMGHVDHGKTTLLDTLRSASVAKGEAGGITQHIGAFSLPVSSLSTGSSSSNDDREITFLDTPGHAAFSAMRARGAKCTDIIVLVVAADDGVMPQTREVIELVKKDDGGVGLVVAINKVDKPEADAERVKNMLLAEGVSLDGYGGEVPYVEVSGLTGKGLDNLMETISLVSELMELRAEREGTAVGYILESKIVKGFGPVATVLLLRGDLTPGSHLIAGTVGCRVRSISDHTSKTLKSVYPGTAVTVSGWKELPKAGDEVVQGKNEEEVKRAITNRKRQEELNSVVEDVDAINHKRRLERERREAQLAALKNGQVQPNAPKPLFSPEVPEDDNRAKELKLVIKADVTGSAEAVVGALQGIGNNKAISKVISSNVGDVTEGDVTLAKAIGATIIAFSVKTPRPILQMALSQNVTILTSSIIYRLMEEVTDKVIALLPPIIEQHVRGEATVQQQFEISLKQRQVLKVAGCKVSNGIIERQRQARLIRKGKIIFEGTLESLKHLKDEVMEMRKGTECGIAITGWKENFLPGDIIQMYEVITKPGLLG